MFIVYTVGMLFTDDIKGISYVHQRHIVSKTSDFKRGQMLEAETKAKIYGSRPAEAKVLASRPGRDAKFLASRSRPRLRPIRYNVKILASRL